MRRYLGSDWLTVRESARLLSLSIESVERLIDQGRFSVVWLTDAGRSRTRVRPAFAYLSRRQVEECAVRFAALEAAYADWGEKGC